MTDGLAFKTAVRGGGCASIRPHGSSATTTAATATATATTAGGETVVGHALLVVVTPRSHFRPKIDRNQIDGRHLVG